MAILNEAIEKFPDNAMFYLEKGKLYLIQHNYIEMVAWAEKAIHKNPAYTEAYDLLGQYHAKAGNRERAENYYLKIKSLQGKKQ